MPKKSLLVSKIDDINRLVNHRFTEEELQTKLKRSGILQQKQNAIERQTIMVRRLAAERDGDREAVEKIDEELRALDGPKLAFGTSLYKAPAPAPQGKSQQERLAEINRANRKANTENVRKAQLAEQKAKRAHLAAVERGEAVADPFSRVKVMPKTHHNVNEQNTFVKPKPIIKKEIKEEIKEEPQQKPKPIVASTELSELSKKYARYDIHLGGPQQPRFLRHKPCDDEIIGNLDLGININVF